MWFPRAVAFEWFFGKLSSEILLSSQQDPKWQRLKVKYSWISDEFYTRGLSIPPRAVSINSSTHLFLLSDRGQSADRLAWQQLETEEMKGTSNPDFKPLIFLSISKLLCFLSAPFIWHGKEDIFKRFISFSSSWFNMHLNDYPTPTRMLSAVWRPVKELVSWKEQRYCTERCWHHT